MGKFLQRQITRVEEKPLGREEHYYDWNGEGGRMVEGVRRCNAAEKPPIGFSHATPVGRKRGVAVPGTEADGERYSPQPSPYAMAITAPRKKRK